MSEASDKILKRVRGLLAKADSTDFPEEAAAFRAKADELMANYAIEQWQLEQSAPGTSSKPEHRDMDTAWYFNKATANVRDDLWRMFQNVAHHCRCKVIYWKGVRTTPVVGLPADLDYMDLLFTSLWLQMYKNLWPTADENLSKAENVYTMKQAGLYWKKIAKELVRVGQIDPMPEGKSEANWVHGLKLAAIHRKFANEHNLERNVVYPTVYQRSYADGFVSEVSSRLWDQRKKQDEKVKEEDGDTSMALVVKSAREKNEEYAGDTFGAPPRSRGSGVSRELASNREAWSAGIAAGSRANISGNPQRNLNNRKQIGS